MASITHQEPYNRTEKKTMLQKLYLGVPCYKILLMKMRDTFSVW